MPEFISGLDLCEAFYREAARPVLDRHWPGLPHAAGLIGYGSDVLGYDDPVSTDHMWGPRFYLFLPREELRHREEIGAAFSRELPPVFRGYSVHFSPPDPGDNGVRHAEFLDQGPVSHLVEITSFEEFAGEYLGVEPERWGTLRSREWLILPEHRLLGLTGGRLFHDGLGIESLRKQLSFYPGEVRRYLIASCWARIGQEQAFVGRCGDRGDEAGARIICARLAERLMRLCFLYCGQYAPYSKWFGTAFRGLDVDPAVGEAVAGALAAPGPEERERCLVRAQELVGELHNRLGYAPAVECRAQPYFGRDIRVVYADRIAEAVAAELAGTDLADLPLIGSMSQVGNLPELADDPDQRWRLEGLYGR